MTVEKPLEVPHAGISFATIVVCACCSVSLLANPILVGVDDRVTVDVGAGEVRTQSDPVVVKPYGTLDKTGEGRLVVPTSTLRDSTDFTMNVRGGTVAITASGEPAEFSSEPPAVISSKATIWLDANVNVDLDGDNVVAWRDRRETKTVTPYDYPRARSREYAAGNGYPWLAGEAGRRKVDFGGYKNGRYMAMLNTNSSDTATATLLDNFRHVFLVHEILTNACYALGYVSGVSPNGGLVFHPGSSAASTNDVIISPSDGRKSIHGRLERNGLLIDSTTEKPITGMQLYDWHFTGATGSAKEYAGLGNFSALCNGMYSGRQGGGILSEIIAFRDWLTEEERIEVAGYLMKKWGITSAATLEGQPQVHTAEGAAVEAPVNTVDVRGEGRYAPTLSGGEIEQIDVDGLADFHGTLDLPYAQAMRTMEEFPLEVAAGDRLDVTNSFDGIVLTRYSDQDAGTLTKDGIGGAIIHSIPSGVTNLNVNGGILRLTPRPWAVTVAPGTNVAASIKNANFEAATGTKYIAAKWGSGIDSDPFSYTPAFSWAGEAWKTPDGLYSAGWVWIGTGANYANAPTPDGAYRITFYGQTFAYQTNIEVSVAGIYELSFLAQHYSSLGGTHPVLEVALGDANGTPEGTNMVVLAEVQSFNDRGWARYRYVTPFLTAGTHHLRIGNTPDTCQARSHTNLDDISLRLVSRPSTAWAVPNGDFETLAHTNALPTTNMIAKAVGWTFTQGAWGTNTTLPGAFVLRYGTSINLNVPICASTEHHRGHTQLALVKGSTAATTFKPLRTGIYRLRGRIGMWNIGNLNGINTRSAPLVKVTCRQGEGAEVTLDSRYAQKRTFATVVWNTDVTFADTNTTVTLTLSNTTDNSVALIDDLEFVPAHEVREDFSAIVKNGNNFSSNWMFFNNRVEGDTKSAAGNVTDIGTGVYYGYNRYRNNTSGARIIDRGAMYQSVTFPGPGRYRLKWHSRARADVRDAAYTAAFQYGKKSALRVVLADGGVTNTIFEGSTATTNFVGYACTFDITDASKTYALGFLGANDPAVSGVNDQASYICNLKCDRIGEAGLTCTSFVVDSGMSINVTTGAKIELDYAGTNTVASLRLAGHRVTGVVDAKSHPLFVVGTGALYVKPRGMVIDFK